MKVLLTGGSGFLGSYFESKANQKIVTIGRDFSNDIICDLSKNIPKIPNNIIKVIHAAGLAHLGIESKANIESLYKANVTSTKNLIDGLSNNLKNIKQFIYISSVSVYGLEQGENINEDYQTNPKAYYAKYKLECEKLITEWANEFGISLTIFRLPLIFGKNPPGNLGKLINSINSGFHISLGDGMARKSIVLAQDVASICLKITNNSGTYNLTDKSNPSFKDIEKNICKRLQKKITLRVPHTIINFFCTIGDFLPESFPLKTKTYNKINSTLSFCDKKASIELNWAPQSVLKSNEWL